MRPWRRLPEHDRGGPRPSVTPDQQHESRDRDQRVQALPRAFADAGDLRAAPGIGEYAQRMRAEKHDQAENQQAHRLVSLTFAHFRLVSTWNTLIIHP